jgi:hypothetical protein
VSWNEEIYYSSYDLILGITSAQTIIKPPIPKNTRIEPRSAKAWINHSIAADDSRSVKVIASGTPTATEESPMTQYIDDCNDSFALILDMSQKKIRRLQ